MELSASLTASVGLQKDFEARPWVDIMVVIVVCTNI